MRKSTKGTAAAALAGLLVLTSLSPASAQTLTWKITPSPAIKGDAELNDVSCPSASFCVAAGLTGNAHPGPLIESWNGTASSIVNTPSAPGGQLLGVSCTSRSMTIPARESGELSGVSCNSPSVCAAVGAEANGPRSKIWFWNGKKWSGVSTPSPTKTQANQLLGVARPSARTCTAVGIITSNSSYKTKNLIETGRAGT